MKTIYEKFRVKPGEKISLAECDPDYTFNFKPDDREAALKLLKSNNRRIAQLQSALYSENAQSLLIVLQALDAGGKDGTIDNVFSAMNPQGCRVQSFKPPTLLEQSHDFLWRVHPAVPRRGEVVIFNRSHYEAVLIERVHELATPAELEFRYRAINDFEALLNSCRTRIVKFYLHISSDEQLRRFVRRLKDPGKHWKISANDYPERKFWDDYIAAYETMLEKCSTETSPWFVIPGNCKWFRNLAVSQIILDTLEAMNIKLPEPSVNLRETRRLAAIELAQQRRERRGRRNRSGAKAPDQTTED